MVKIDFQKKLLFGDGARASHTSERIAMAICYAMVFAIIAMVGSVAQR